MKKYLAILISILMLSVYSISGVIGCGGSDDSVPASSTKDAPVCTEAASNYTIAVDMSAITDEVSSWLIAIMALIQSGDEGGEGVPMSISTAKDSENPFAAVEGILAMIPDSLDICVANLGESFNLGVADVSGDIGTINVLELGVVPASTDPVEAAVTADDINHIASLALKDGLVSSLTPQLETMLTNTFSGMEGADATVAVISSLVSSVASNVLSGITCANIEEFGCASLLAEDGFTFNCEITAIDVAEIISSIPADIVALGQVALEETLPDGMTLEMMLALVALAIPEIGPYELPFVFVPMAEGETCTEAYYQALYEELGLSDLLGGGGGSEAISYNYNGASLSSGSCDSILELVVNKSLRISSPEGAAGPGVATIDPSGERQSLFEEDFNLYPSWMGDDHVSVLTTTDYEDNGHYYLTIGGDKYCSLLAQDSEDENSLGAWIECYNDPSGPADPESPYADRVCRIDFNALSE